jgi:hypothetical protein
MLWYFHCIRLIWARMMMEEWGQSRLQDSDALAD